MVSSRRKGGWFSPSSLVAAVLVAAAGGIAWYETGTPGPSNRPGATAATLAVPPETSSATASDPAARPPAGSLPTRVVLESVGIDAPITGVGAVEAGGKLTWETAWRAAGHHIDSARPGQPGNMVLTGHVSVADRGNIPVFASLGKVAPGDTVKVFSGDQVFTYRITKVSVVSPAETRVLRSSPAATVTLITCTSDLKKRLVVVGTLVQGA
ncbi:MAG: sortase [Chloroflexi bacterium]|nr:sortase [Chloroflexota bacterium]